MIDGMWWVVILLVVVGALWLLAHLRGDKNRSHILNKDRDHKAKNNQKHPHKTFANTAPNSALQKTAELLRQHFPKYLVTLINNHLSLSEQNKKIAMITIDKKIAIGERRLGEVMVINYHRAPNQAQLDRHFKTVQ